MAPLKAMLMATILPGGVLGAMSPYPTVERVITVTYTELKYESKALQISSPVSYLKYGSSYTLRIQAKVRIHVQKPTKTKGPGLIAMLVLNVKMMPALKP